MSAFVVERAHIQFLIEAGLCLPLHGDALRWENDGARQVLTSSNATEVGQMLWDENIASVSHRYPGDRELPGPIGENFEYAHKRVIHAKINPVEVLKACDCLEYQSCEHPAWESSAACAFLNALRQTAICKLPGYEEARWGVPKSFVLSIYGG